MSVASQVRSAFPFSITKLPLRGPDNLPTPHYGLFRSDTGSCVPIAVTSRFMPHQTDDVVTLAEAVQQGFELPTERLSVDATWFNTGHRVSIKPDKEFRRSVYGSKDTLVPQVTIRGDYGGMFMVSLGFYRDLCLNMSRLRYVNGTTITVAHRGNFREQFDSLVTRFRKLTGSFETILAQVERFEGTRVSMDEFFSVLFPPPAKDASDNKHTRHRNVMRTILQRLSHERKEAGRPDAYDYTGSGSVWELVNAVTGYYQHDSQVRGNVSKVDRAFRAVDSDECNRAWQYAYELAS